MNDRKNRGAITIDIKEIAYYLSIVIIMGAKGIGLTEGQKIFNMCMLVAALFWGIKLILTSYTIKEWVVIAVSGFVGGIIYFRTGEKAALAAVMIIVGMKDIPPSRMMKICLGIWGITFFPTIVMGLLGMNKGVIVVHEKLGLGPIIRYSLGFTHPNVLHVSYFIFVMLLIFVIRPKGKNLYWLAFFLFLGNIYFFLYSISYTGIIIVTGYLFLCLYFDFRKSLSKLEKVVIQLILGVSIIFPLVGPFIFKGKVFNFFNNLLSTRFELVYNLFNENKISLLGTKMVLDSEAHLSLDSSFAYMLMNYGIIAFIFIVLLYFCALHYCISRNRLSETAILLSVAVAGITEQFLFNLSFKNITFFIMGNVLFDWILKGKNKNVWNKEYNIIKIKKTNISIPIPAFFHRYFALYQDVICNGWKKIFWGGIIFAVILLAGSGLFYKTKDYVIVEKYVTDYRGNDEFTIDKNTISSEDNYISIGDISIGNRAYIFRDNILIIERIRYILSVFIWGVISGITIIAGIWGVFLYKKSGEKNVY